LLRSDAEPLDVRIQELGDRAEIPGDKRPIATEDRVHALAVHEAQRTVATSRPSSTRHDLAPIPLAARRRNSSTVPESPSPSAKLRRLSSSPRAHSALVGCGLWAGTRMQGQFSTSYAVWGVRRLGRLPHPQPLADLCDETRHVLSLRRRGLVETRHARPSL